jgi:hypothetical protein
MASRRITISGVHVTPSPPGRTLPWAILNNHGFIHGFAKTEADANEQAEQIRAYLRTQNCPEK